ncbi:conserved hypothetical protein [Leishmania mexicana MHOM/GT/2001/U1103]|uniref:Uncharacterized protein n=1 Tax=Leishmania mexicana (strain MHOM/GT/2001/U1103) TaxID=929439 RepID=E9AMY7_LEIMU|nr:conserved hypothetical protein [Leishmania mexicana MHOM/GT/2001/U1103]CBZ24292.1 conserved hypothetical protein [Leishmania mexicana MHOM/GT/2001/U1103]
MQAPKTSTLSEKGEVVHASRQSFSETPFVTDPAEVTAFDIPVEYVRRIEDAQRVYSNHYMEHRMYTDAWNHAAMTLGFQCCWLGVGAWIVSRGLSYSDPMNSIVARWVQHSRVRRFTTPISCLGLFIFTATCAQLPYDFQLLREASAGIDRQTALMKKSMDERHLAYREGKIAKEHLEAKEAEAFAKGMKVE